MILLVTFFPEGATTFSHLRHSSDGLSGSLGSTISKTGLVRQSTFPTLPEETYYRHFSSSFSKGSGVRLQRGQNLPSQACGAT